MNWADTAHLKVEQQAHGNSRLAALTESALGVIDVEIANVNRMLSELDRPFPEG